MPPGGFRMSEPQNSQPAKAAVIGLGAMGMGMAQSLVRAGFDVTGCDVSRGAVERLVAAGGRGAASPAEAASGADRRDQRRGQCRADRGRAVRREWLRGGDAGRRGVHLMRDHGPGCRPRSGQRLEAQGRLYLDAPISGGAKRAAEGALTVLTSGSAAAYDKARPALSGMAQTVHRARATSPASRRRSRW